MAPVYSTVRRGWLKPQPVGIASRAKPDWSRNAADPYPVEIGGWRQTELNEEMRCSGVRNTDLYELQMKICIYACYTCRKGKSTEMQTLGQLMLHGALSSYPAGMTVNAMKIRMFLIPCEWSTQWMVISKWHEVPWLASPKPTQQFWCLNSLYYFSSIPPLLT